MLTQTCSDKVKYFFCFCKPLVDRCRFHIYKHPYACSSASGRGEKQE
jgi:hypothetical protein